MARVSFLDREVEAQLKRPRRRGAPQEARGFLDREVEAQLKPGVLWQGKDQHVPRFLDREVEAQLKQSHRGSVRLQVDLFPRPRGRGPIEARPDLRLPR